MPLARLEHPKDGRAELVLSHPERRNATSIGLLEEAIRLIQGLGSDRVFGDSGRRPTFLCRDRPRRGAGELGHLLSAAPFAFPTDACGSACAGHHDAPVQRRHCGGFGLLCACDFAIGTPNTKVGYPPIELGLSPALMTPWLVQKIGPSAARSVHARGHHHGHGSGPLGIVDRSGGRGRTFRIHRPFGRSTS